MGWLTCATSTASQSVWTEVKQEVEQLLETAHLVTKQAAHRLLSFEGSEEAYKLQRTLPDNLFPLSPFHEAYEKDPCTSLFAWTQEVCESCLQRKDLSPGHIAKRMKLHCVNPALPIPDDLGTRLEPLTREINTESLWSLMGSTGDDIAFDEYEPSLCAYAPYALADLVRRVVCQAEQRKDLSLRQLAWRLKEHSLIFGAEETNSVYRAWQGLCEIPAWNKTEESAEFFLFDSILRGLDSQGQLEHLLARPDEARDLATYEVDFLPVVDWAVVWSELGSPQNAKRRQRTLWFLSSYPNSIPKRCISENLAAFLSHEDSLVRSSVLKILYVTKDEQTIDIFIKDGWTWDRSFCDRENHWGSLLLCEHGDALTYTELRSRLHPVYLGYAIQCRGMEDSEVDQYAEDIHHLWSRIGIATPDLPSDFPPTDIETSEDITQRTRLRLSPSTLSRSITFISCDSTWGGGDRGNAADVFRSWESGDQERQNMAQIARQTIEEQIEAGNLWFAQDFRACALEQVMNRRPDLVSQWVEFALADTDDAIRRVRLARSFYEALCTMLLEHNPDTGSDLYWRLLKISGGITVRDARSEIRLLDYALFKAPANEIQNAWERRLEECTTDQELMQIAIVAQHGNGGDWLEAYIYERTQSSVPLERCRALTLLGFMETEESFELLNELLETAPATWIQDLLTTSLKRRQTNAWAKHWFQRFLTVDDDILAWAAFRLFLQCVDSRFWFWQQDVQSEVGDNAQLERRLAFLKSNSGTIEKRVRKNEKGLTENLFGQKARQNQAWPWIQIF